MKKNQEQPVKILVEADLPYEVSVTDPRALIELRATAERGCKALDKIKNLLQAQNIGCTEDLITRICCDESVEVISEVFKEQAMTEAKSQKEQRFSREAYILAAESISKQVIKDLEANDIYLELQALQGILAYINWGNFTCDTDTVLKASKCAYANEIQTIEGMHAYNALCSVLQPLNEFVAQYPEVGGQIIKAICDTGKLDGHFAAPPTFNYDKLAEYRQPQE